MPTKRIKLVKYNSNRWHCRIENVIRFEIYTWCFETFNDLGYRWECAISNNIVYLRDEDDAMLFMMRWS